MKKFAIALFSYPLLLVAAASATSLVSFRAIALPQSITSVDELSDPVTSADELSDPVTQQDTASQRSQILRDADDLLS